MKKTLFLIVISFTLHPLYAQSNLLTESFETDGEGTRYSSNHFDTACHDFFERYLNGGGNCLTNEPNNINGTYYWAGEDVDQASGGTGVLTLNPVDVTGFNLEVQALIAIGRPNDGRFEPSDELLFQYNMDDNGWITFGAFYGDNDIPSNIDVGNLAQDLDLDGMYDPGGPKVDSSNFTDWTFNIPATGNSLQIRVIMGQNTGTEEIVIDNIRINSVAPLPVQLSYFTVSKIDHNKVDISWQTHTEVNNEKFEVQRSSDMREWNSIAEKPGIGNGTSISNYSVSDQDPLKGISYYRLKQIDFDGQVFYSPYKHVNFYKSQESNIISVYPNPANNEVFVKGHGISPSSIMLRNNLGLDLSEKINIEKISEESYKLNVSQLPVGIYYIYSNTDIHKINIIH